MIGCRDDNGVSSTLNNDGAPAAAARERVVVVGRGVSSMLNVDGAAADARKATEGRALFRGVSFVGEDERIRLVLELLPLVGCCCFLFI